MTEIQRIPELTADGLEFLLRDDDSRTVKNRLTTFIRWCQDQRIFWIQANLREYRDWLLDNLAAVSTSAHLSTLRQRIRDLCEDNEFTRFLYAYLRQQNPELDFANIELRVQALLRSLHNMSNARHSRVRVIKEQDRADSQRLWLNGGLDQELLLAVANQAPHPYAALRNTAVVSCFLISGIRVQELCNLVIADLYETFGGQPALRVRQGKGNKQRMVLYGDLIDGLHAYIEPWLDVFERRHEHDQPVFCGFWHGYQKLRLQTRMNTATINRMLESITLSNGQYATPHDLRRTYARTLYEPPFNMRLDSIKAQMGHSSVRITEEYVGQPDIQDRIPLIQKGV